MVFQRPRHFFSMNFHNEHEPKRRIKMLRQICVEDKCSTRQRGTESLRKLQSVSGLKLRFEGISTDFRYCSAQLASRSLSRDVRKIIEVLTNLHRNETYKLIFFVD